MSGLRRALAFLTTWPISIPEGIEAGELGRAAAWFPFIGLAMGGVLWGLDVVLPMVMPPSVVGVLLVAAWIGLSGGLHLDGLADCCDGLFVSAPHARRLEILRDTGVGAFAIVGVTLLLLAKAMSAGVLADSRGLLLAPVLGRWVVLPLARGPAARGEGLGATLRAELTVRQMLPGLVLAVLLSFLSGWRGVAAFMAVHLMALGWHRLAKARLGGHTGDVLGAACELAEVTVLLAFAWVS